MSIRAMYRIAIWATAGFLVSAGWGVYFANADRSNPIEPITYALARLTQPLAAFTAAYFDFPRGLSSAEFENAAFYALVGLIVEVIRRRYFRFMVVAD